MISLIKRTPTWPGLQPLLELEIDTDVSLLWTSKLRTIEAIEKASKRDLIELGINVGVAAILKTDFGGILLCSMFLQ